MPDILTSAEIERIINDTHELRYQTYILTTYSMGLRLGEALNLTVGDVDGERMKLDYHPHVHIVVPGGGLDVRRRQWRKLRGRYLFNEFNLATVFRAKLLAALRTQSLTLPDQVPAKWVVSVKG